MYSNQNLELALHSLPIIIQELLQKWLLGICITTCLLGLSVFFQIARTLYTILPGWEKRLLILSVEFHWSWLSVLETYSGPSIYTLPWNNICDLLQRMHMLALRLYQISFDFFVSLLEGIVRYVHIPTWYLCLVSHCFVFFNLYIDLPQKRKKRIFLSEASW